MVTMIAHACHHVVAITIVMMILSVVSPVEAFLRNTPSAFVSRQRIGRQSHLVHVDKFPLFMSGGATVQEDEEEGEDLGELEPSDEDDEQEDDEEPESLLQEEEEEYEEEEIELESTDNDEDVVEEQEDLDPKLAKSTQAAASKTSIKQTKAALNEVVTSKILASQKLYRGYMGTYLRIPYIVRACVNPLTAARMTRAYFASLFNLNYLEDNMDVSQNLRSALETKAKKGSGGASRGKRRFRPGQAKVCLAEGG